MMNLFFEMYLYTVQIVSKHNKIKFAIQTEKSFSAEKKFCNCFASENLFTLFVFHMRFVHFPKQLCIWFHFLLSASRKTPNYIINLIYKSSILLFQFHFQKMWPLPTQTYRYILIYYPRCESTYDALQLSYSWGIIYHLFRNYLPNIVKETSADMRKGSRNKILPFSSSSYFNFISKYYRKILFSTIFFLVYS